MKKLTKEKVKKIIDLRIDKNLNSNQIKGELGLEDINNTTINNILSLKNWKINYRDDELINYHQNLNTKIVGYINLGLKYKDIAKILNIEITNIKARVLKYKLRKDTDLIVFDANKGIEN